MKNKETLEEAAEIFVKNRFTKQISGDESYPDIYASKESIVESHILFAKWQQERSFTLEQIDELFFNDKGGYFDDFLDYRLGLSGNQGKNRITFKEWFETFKKK